MPSMWLASMRMVQGSSVLWVMPWRDASTANEVDHEAEEDRDDQREANSNRALTALIDTLLFGAQSIVVELISRRHYSFDEKHEMANNWFCHFPGPGWSRGSKPFKDLANNRRSKKVCWQFPLPFHLGTDRVRVERSLRLSIHHRQGKRDKSNRKHIDFVCVLSRAPSSWRFFSLNYRIPCHLRSDRNVASSWAQIDLWRQFLRNSKTSSINYLRRCRGWCGCSRFIDRSTRLALDTTMLWFM